MRRYDRKAVKNRNLRRRIVQRGQSMVEFAVLLPIFFALVFSIIEIGRAWAVKQALTIAAREGARVLVLPYGAGLIYNSEDVVQQAAVTRVNSYLNSSGVPTGAGTQVTVVRITPGNDATYNTGDDVLEQNYSNGKRGDRVGIQITHNFDTALPLVLNMFNNTNNQYTGTGIAMGVTCYMDHE
ncbi:MAG: pilus assembly protein [Acidobacteria bacterium]|nr:pilus assembly protein [Acidobacteriota bacterium]